MRHAGLGRFGRLAARLATWFTPPFYAREYLAKFHPHGYISPRATIYHSDLRLGANIFVDDGVLIFQDRHGGSVELGDRAHLYRDTHVQTGAGGTITIGADTHIQPRCQLSAYKAGIHIGRGVAIAPNCAFYPYDHGIAAGRRIEDQPLKTKGDIIIGDDAWLGTGVIVLAGVRIGHGAVVGAGSIVTKDVPDDCVAVGVPARVIKKRCDGNGNPDRRGSSEHREACWSIGILTGSNPYRFDCREAVYNPVLTQQDVSDVAAAFVADPFMIRQQNLWHMFFEVMNRRTGKGEIGWATSADSFKWNYQRIVLAEPFHLSYPYVFEWQSEYYMIPESHKTEEIRLYKAAPFPTEWIYMSTLLTGFCFKDSSIFRHAGRWWLFTETNPQSRFDTLRLYYADELQGPWREHPKSPIIQGNPHIARPAGRVVVLPDRIIRYTQDCYPTYGRHVWAFQIIELTRCRYRERLLGDAPVLMGNGMGWNAGGMHHIDPHHLEEGRWVACVDGWSTAFRQQTELSERRHITACSIESSGASQITSPTSW